MRHIYDRHKTTFNTRHFSPIAAVRARRSASALIWHKMVCVLALNEGLPRVLIACSHYQPQL